MATITSSSLPDAFATDVLDALATETSAARKFKTDGVNNTNAETWDELMNIVRRSVKALDGLNASTAELNILDAVTASSTELNKNDGAAGYLLAHGSAGRLFKSATKYVTGSTNWSPGLAAVEEGWATYVGGTVLTTQLHMVSVKITGGTLGIYNWKATSSTATQLIAATDELRMRAYAIGT